GPPAATAREARLSEAQQAELVRDIQARKLTPVEVSSALASVRAHSITSCPADRYEDLRHALFGNEPRTPEQARRVDDLVERLQMDHPSFLRGLKANFDTEDVLGLSRKQVAELIRLLELKVRQKTETPPAAPGVLGQALAAAVQPAVRARLERTWQALEWDLDNRAWTVPDIKRLLRTVLEAVLA